MSVLGGFFILLFIQMIDEFLGGHSVFDGGARFGYGFVTRS